MTIREFINKTKSKNRDAEVRKVINDYYKNNVEALTDGIVYNYIIIGNTVSERMLQPYDMDMNEFKSFQKVNPILKMGHKVVNNPLKLGLITSYYDTKDKTFLDMIGLIEAGSKFYKYFQHGVSSPEKMKYVIENKLSNKYLIKKHGSMFVVIQEQIQTMLDSPALKERFKRMNDQDIHYIINRISTTINSTYKEISKVYYKYIDEEVASTVMTQSELNLDGSKTSLSNNSIDVDNLKNLVVNYMPTNLDYEVLNVCKIKSPIKKFVMKKVILDREKKYFSRFGIKFIDYYVYKYNSDIVSMKKDFIPKLLSARLNDPEVNKLIEEISKDIRAYADQYGQTSGEYEGLNTNAGIYAFYNEIKAYIIIKIRKLMNEID